MVEKGEPSPLKALRESRSLSQEDVARYVGVDSSTVQRWESGETRRIRARNRAKLAERLRVSPEEIDDRMRLPLAAFSRVENPPSAGTLASRQTRTGTAVTPPRSSNPSGWVTPRRVDRVRAMTAALADAENQFGGGTSGGGGAAQFQWAARLLDAPAPSTERQALAEAVGNLASVVAHTAFDRGDHETADEYFKLALDCADKAPSWELRANTLAEMARKEIYLNKEDDALTLVELALVRSDRLTATARAMLYAVRAGLLARAGRHSEALDEIAQSDACFAERDISADPPWLRYYDNAEHAGSTGKALIPLALTTGDPNSSVERLATAVRSHTETYPRSRVFSQIRLSRLLFATGHPAEALAPGIAAVDDAATIQSVRVATELAGLSRTAQLHHNDDTRQLRHAIASITTEATA